MPHTPLFTPQEMRERLRRIRAVMTSRGLDAIITSNQPNIRYTTGFRGEPHTLLLTESEAVLYTSFRTLPWAQEQTQELHGDIELSSAPDALDEISQRLQQRLPQSAQTIGVDASLSHLRFQKLQDKFSPHKLLPATPIEQTRRCKSAAEIELLTQSQRLNESIFEAILPQIQLGMTERQVQGLILAEMACREDVEGYSFAPIVATGGNAWEIHHLPDDTPIQNNNLLLLDLGVFRQGYASDMTRTICLGKATAEMKAVYQTVRKAQEAAITAIKEGSYTHQIDEVARQIITQAGHGKSFTHGLGHSIGLETHDPGLNLSQAQPTESLAKGMAFTVEPGIYLQDAFGVRTEDVIIVTEGGPLNITNQPKDLLELSL